MASSIKSHIFICRHRGPGIFLSRTRQRRRFAAENRRGFTLIEILVSIGIIALLLAIALPTILLAKKRGTETRIKSDLALIGTALDAYRDQFGNYPQFPDPATVYAESSGVPQWLDYSAPRGAVLLCAALIGAGPANSGNLTVVSSPNFTPGDDGADGSGFRARRSFIGSTTSLGGKVYGPYVDASKFKLKYLPANPSYPNAYPVMLDILGNPILYYPGTTNAPQVQQLNGYVSEQKPASFVSGQQMPLYNAVDNENTGPISSPQYQNFLSPMQMAYILGERIGGPGGTYQLGSAETPVTTQPYLLWTAGSDGIFGFGVDASGNPKVPAPGMKTDDICNFEIPPDLKK